MKYLKPFEAKTGVLYSVLDFSYNPICPKCGQEVRIQGQMEATGIYRAIWRRWCRVFFLAPPLQHDPCGVIDEIALFQSDSPYVGNACNDPEQPWRLIFNQMLSTPTLEKYTTGGLNDKAESW